MPFFGQDLDLVLLLLAAAAVSAAVGNMAWAWPAVTWTAGVFAALAALRFGVSLVKRPVSAPVIITGCDTGFGNMTAKQLAATGVAVYAGCLTPKAVAELKDHAKAHSLPIYPSLLDVTKHESVLAFARAADEALLGGASALINNAGVMKFGLLELAPLADLTSTLDVNVKGMYDVTQALLPTLRRAKGRVVCISSILGRSSPPGTSAYSGSKYAVQAFADAWRAELRVWGIDVVLVEPGAMATPLLDSIHDTGAVDKLWAGLTPAHKELYGLEYLRNQHTVLLRTLRATTSNPQRVVDTLMHIVTVRYPRARYPVGYDAALSIPLSFLPSSITDILIHVILNLGLTPPAALLKK